MADDDFLNRLYAQQALMAQNIYPRNPGQPPETLKSRLQRLNSNIDTLQARVEHLQRTRRADIIYYALVANAIYGVMMAIGHALGL